MATGRSVTSAPSIVSCRALPLARKTTCCWPRASIRTCSRLGKAGRRTLPSLLAAPTERASASNVDTLAPGNQTWRACNALKPGSAKAAERPRFGRKHRLLHPREKRSAPQRFAEDFPGSVYLGGGLVSLVAAQTLPRPIAGL